MSSTVATRAFLWYQKKMKSIAGTNKRRGRGRPRVDSTPINLRLPPDLISGLDHLIADMPDQNLTRPEAIRQVLADHLRATGHLDAIIEGQDGTTHLIQAKRSKPPGTMK